jgi:hypothetical protein
LDDGQEDLKKVYNADKILGAADLLKTPSFSFPYFGNTEAGKPGPNQNFSKFASDFTSTEHNEFLVNQKGTSTDTGNLGLINIPNSGYSDSTDATLALINMSSDSSSDNTPFETYVAPLFDIFQQENAPIDAATYVMPTSSNPDATDTTVFADSTNILNNFLFTNSDESTSVKKVPS